MGADFSIDGYDLIGLLTADVSGELWDAREHATGSRVALRRLAVRDGNAQDKARRFVSVLGRLDHPGLLRVREVVPRESELVVVLDPAERGDLERLLLLRGRLDPGEVVTIGSAAASALAALHGHGLVHGGVTTSAICFTADGRVLVAEPAVDPADAIPAADVHGLAGVCYTALTGVPFDAGERRPLLEVAPGVPAALAQTVEAGLRPEPAERPSMASFGSHLEGAARPAPVAFTDVPFFAELPPPPAEPDADEEPPARRKRWPAVAIGGLAALVVVVVALVTWQLVREARQAERQDTWRAVLVDLDRRKADAWERLDPALLSLVYVTGSQALKTEQAAMDVYLKQDVATVQGVSWTISSFEVESESAEQVVLAVESRFNPYIVTYQDGKRWRMTPEGQPKRLRITLVPDDGGGWLISRSTELK